MFGVWFIVIHMLNTANNDARIASATLAEADAAAYINLSPSFLRASRLKPPRTSGPPYVRMGRAIRYLKSDLDAWLESRRVQVAA